MFFNRLMTFTSKWRWWLLGGLITTVCIFLAGWSGTISQIVAEQLDAVMPTNIHASIDAVVSSISRLKNFVTANAINFFGLIAAICSAWATYQAKVTADKQLESNRAWLYFSNITTKIMPTGDILLQTETKNCGKLPAMVPHLNINVMTANIGDTSLQYLSKYGESYSMIVGPGDTRISEIILLSSDFSQKPNMRYFLECTLQYKSPNSGKKEKKDAVYSQELNRELIFDINSDKPVVTLKIPEFATTFDHIRFNASDREFGKSKTPGGLKRNRLS